jgi:hypothetical protein
MRLFTFESGYVEVYCLYHRELSRFSLSISLSLSLSLFLSKMGGYRREQNPADDLRGGEGEREVESGRERETEREVLFYISLHCNEYQLKCGHTTMKVLKKTAGTRSGPLFLRTATVL